MLDKIAPEVWLGAVGLGLCALLFFIVRSNSEKTPETVVIDGCEYLHSYSYYGSKVITHKGNCTNWVHWK